MSDSMKTIDEILPDILKRSADKGYVQKKDVELAKAQLQRIMAAERLDERIQVRVYNEFTNLGRNEKDSRIAQLEQLIAAVEEEG